MTDITTLSPSQLIRHALADLRACEVSPKYEIKMLDWHEPKTIDAETPRVVCNVCLAGAVIAQTLLRPYTRYVTPCFFPREQENVLVALDHLRGGAINVALDLLGYKDQPYTDAFLHMEERLHPLRAFYDKYDPEPFYEWMTTLADTLQEHGL